MVNPRILIKSGKKEKASAREREKTEGRSKGGQGDSC